MGYDLSRNGLLVNVCDRGKLGQELGFGGRARAGATVRG